MRYRTPLAAALASLLAFVLLALFTPVRSQAQADILLVFAVAEPADNDLMYINILDGLGLTYDVVTGAEATPEMAAAYQAMVISESVTSSSIGNRFNELTVPVVTMEGFVQDDMQFTGNVENTHYGFVANIGPAINVVGDHPVLGGLPNGLVPIYQSDGSMQWGIPIEGATILATLPDDPTRPVFYLVETGTTLLDGTTTPARRAFFTPHSSISQSMTDQGHRLIANLILWAIGSEEYYPIEAGITASYTATPGSGYAPLTVEFDASSSASASTIVSYDWSFPDGSTASGVTVTYEFTEVGNWPVTLTITDDLGQTSELTRTIAVGAPVSFDPHFTIPAAASAPTIDGTMDAGWADAVELPIANLANGVAPTDEADLSANVRVMYDATNLYAFYTVTDADLYNDSPASWQDDAVDLYLDGLLEKCYNCYDANDAQFELSYNSDAITGISAGGPLAAGVTYAWSDVEGGYTIEVAVPWANFGVNPETGLVVGIEFMVNDDDVGGDVRDTKLAWFSDQDNTFQYAQLMGNAELGMSTVAAEPDEQPISFGIESAYPNPFNPTTTLLLNVPDAGIYEISVYNVLGARVHRDEVRASAPGQVRISLDFAGLASGAYLTSILQKATGKVVTKPVVLVR